VYCVIDPVDAGFPGARTVIRTYREVWETRKTGKKDKFGRDIRRPVGKPTKEMAWHVSSLDPDSRSAEKFAEIVRTHWYVETYHGQRPRHDSVASPAMLAECPDGSPRHVRRGLEPLNGRNCGRGPRFRAIRLAGRRSFQRNAALESDRSRWSNEPKFVISFSMHSVIYHAEAQRGRVLRDYVA